MPVINGIYLKDFPTLGRSPLTTDLIPIAFSSDNVAYKATVAQLLALGSVGLTMPSAFSVANSPVQGSGTLAVTAAGVASQYIRGDGTLSDFPSNGGGGSSVSYYLNGSVNQGTIGGNAYKEMNKTPVLGTGTDFTIGADGYIAQFITDANDPATLLIPGGNWNVEMYFSASSSGGTPSFYVELYKYDGATFTLLGSSSTTPEGITNGTAIDIYYTSFAVPETVLTLTDRLAIRVYVNASGRTITLHTEDNHLSEIITTFSNGLTALNGLTKQVQYFATGTTGTDFAISSSVDTHTFNLPSASAANRGALSSTDWSTFNGKQAALNGTGFVKISGTTISYDNSTYLTTASAASTYVPYTGATSNVDLGSYTLSVGSTLPSKIGQNTIESKGFTFLDAGSVYTGLLQVGTTLTAARTWSLPNATGTLALTSALSDYLPLAGGTLTGALTGTSASFSGNLAVDTNVLYVDTTSDSVGVNASTFTSTAFSTNLLVKNSNSSLPAGITVNGGAQSSYLFLSHDLTGTLPFLEIGEYYGSMQMLHYNGTQSSRPIAYNGTTKKLSFQTDGTDRITVFSTGNAFIGSSASDAGYKLDVNGTGNFSGALTGTSATFSGNITSTSIANITGTDGGGKQLRFIGGVTTYNGLIAVQENYANTLEITASSAVGTTTFNRNIAKFNLSDLSTTLAGALSGTSATFSSSVTATAFYTSSDINLKNVLSRANTEDFNTISYNWKDKEKDTKLHYGYAAQEVMKVLPDLVSKGDDGHLSVNYTEALVYKIMKLEQRIKQLELR